VITPCNFEAGETWHTTDLFVDIWRGEYGGVEILDLDELDYAVGRAWITESDADAALAEATRIVAMAAAGLWPPPLVWEWTRERVRESLAVHHLGRAQTSQVHMEPLQNGGLLS